MIKCNTQVGTVSVNHEKNEYNHPVDVHFVDVKSHQYVGKKLLNIMISSIFPDRGIITMNGKPVTLHGDKWVYWIGAVPT